jgi:hypothetical protein
MDGNCFQIKMPKFENNEKEIAFSINHVAFEVV